jgi:[ribosomal protein S18]-alanine N-acetyltransferase
VPGENRGGNGVSAVVSTPEPVMRPMREVDLTEVLVVERLAYEYPWTLSIFWDCLRIGYQCYVYQVPTGFIGHGVMSVAVGECHLLNICIHPDYQRRGLGRSMVETLLTLARGRKARMALLEVRVSNTAAYRLYTGLGFDEIGVRKNYYPVRTGREDAIILAREL